MSNQRNIIYIIGAGRSGTTLLDIVLGNADGFFSAGELNRFTKRNGLPHSPRDEKVSYFWQQVRNQLCEEGYKNPYDYYSLSGEFEYHKSFYKMVLPAPQKKYTEYEKLQHCLFDAIWKYSSSVGQTNHTIIDSSKYPLRGYFLSKIFKEKISFVYIKRNPSDVVESFQKKDVEQPSKGRLSANAYLLGVNIIAQAVLKRVKKTCKTCEINYDDFLAAPANVLKKIESELGIDLSVPEMLISKNLPLKIGYLFDGNRLRTQDEIIFRQRNLNKPAAKTLSAKAFNYLHGLTWYKFQKN